MDVGRLQRRGCIWIFVSNMIMIMLTLASQCSPLGNPMILLIILRSYPTAVIECDISNF